MIGRALTLFLLLLLPSTVWAQETAPDLLPEIVVDAPDEAEITAFVGQALPDTRDRQLARWHRQICVAYRGFDEGQVELFQHRVSEVAALIDMPAPTKDCRPNVVVILTDQPDRLVDLMLEKQARLFKPMPIAQVRQALERERAVRMWYVTMLNHKHGTTPDAVDTAGALSTAVSLRAAPGGLSRLSKETRFDIFRTMVVLDANALRGLPLGAVADHVGMRVLGAFATEGEAALPSILNLFQPGVQRVTALTEWDRSLLRGLYQAPVDTHMNRQRRMIARRLVETATNTAP